MQTGNDIKRSNPLSSARTLSSEGLVLRHSWLLAPRNLRSNCPSHRRDCVNGISTDSLDPPHTWPSPSDTLADCHFCLRTDAQLQLGIFKEKRSSPLISTRTLSSEGLCYGILGSLRQETSALIATHRRDCANLPLACCACTPDSHRLARPTAQMALAQRHSFRTSRFIPRTLMKSGQAL